MNKINNMASLLANEPNKWIETINNLIDNSQFLKNDRDLKSCVDIIKQQPHFLKDAELSKTFIDCCNQGQKQKVSQELIERLFTHIGRLFAVNNKKITQQEQPEEEKNEYNTQKQNQPVQREAYNPFAIFNNMQKKIPEYDEEGTIRISRLEKQYIEMQKQKEIINEQQIPNKQEEYEQIYQPGPQTTQITFDYNTNTNQQIQLLKASEPHKQEISQPIDLESFKNIINTLEITANNEQKDDLGVIKIAIDLANKDRDPYKMTHANLKKVIDGTQTLREALEQIKAAKYINWMFDEQ